ncbi:MAG TPA: ABC transporter ATP-binding protein [Candidatus Corynebacterium gallistercoris]|uniref:ABC transporter ATP-binding protein n=1 Tax=Candidatus Corynebacterium gallistercoris TaxID=2838530 RepID=A0A9D1UQP4_9CORY|nr:ABC transporter ATP-binding protein [Candidatus Corynebacterium gallistercoris]
MITVDNLGKRYAGKQAITNLSFTVPDGQVTGFLGPNGAGKSTTMRCMLGLDKPTTGQALVDGAEFAGLRDKASHVGALLEASWFNPSRSGRSHLQVLARGAGIRDSRVEECLEAVGLGEAGDKKVGGYSLGMKQRLGLAGALLGDPKHLILDEPVNGLDPEGVLWMRKKIRGLAAEGRSVLVSSHLLSEMQQTADRLVVIGKGQLIGEYTMEEFLAGGTSVIVETAQPQQAQQLQQRLSAAGVEVLEVAGGQLSLAVPEGASEREIRAIVARIALDMQVPVTELRTETQNLEQRFLAATADAQEYSTVS